MHERPEHPLERQPAGVQRAGDDRADVSRHQRRGEDVAADGVVAPLEELRDRVQVRADVVRQEDPDEDRVDDPAVPARGGGDDAVRVADAGVGDEVLGWRHPTASIERGDDVPRQRLAAEEVAARGFLSPDRDEEPQPDGEEHVDDEDREVQAVEADLLRHA